MVPYPLSISSVKWYKLVRIKYAKAVNESLEFLIEMLMVALVGFCRLQLLNEDRMPRRLRKK